MNSNRLAYLFVFLAVFLWASTAAVSKLLLFDISNIQLLFFASFFATIALFAIAFFQGKLSLVLSYKTKDYLTFAYMGFLGVFLYFIFLYGAIALLPAQEAFIINYLWPIMVILFAVPILKEKFTTIKLASMLISFIGVFIVATKGDILSLVRWPRETYPL
ncbi:MAG: DMT family transporter [Candidatus Diapherotrites archaeon]